MSGAAQGRTPLIAHQVRAFLPKSDLLAYTDAILRVYNLEGRRDNKYKARIKILVHEKGLEAIRADVEAEFAKTRGQALTLPAPEVARIAAYFALPDLVAREAASETSDARAARDAAYARFVRRNVAAHKRPGYGLVTVSLKPVGGIPGDATAAEMRCVAQVAARFSAGEIRVSHEQNLILPHVALDDLPALYDALAAGGLATPNAGLVSDIIACPGMDYCALATARSIPVAQRLSERFGDGARADEIGELKIKISGCINACGHHHVGHIGILGLEKKGVESYQITLGGTADETCRLGDLTGSGVRHGPDRRCRRYDRRHLPQAAHRPRGDVPRRLPARRHGAVQAGALCRRLSRSSSTAPASSKTAGACCRTARTAATAT